ncbi:uncharacterized protein JCM15063_005148 [Sporobolomyces koalae]|uniref:uncharacterized protein n=1 Tax=Sporobolomyces koalae TaxID=500713 RepID=UPI0031739E55
MPVTTIVRTVLYSFAILLALANLAMCIAFIVYWSEDQPSYYQPSAVLMAASILLLLTLPILHFGFHSRRKQVGVVGSLAFEIAAIFVPWALYLGGSATTAAEFREDFRDDFCVELYACTFAKAMMITGFICWAFLNGLLFITMPFVTQLARSILYGLTILSAIVTFSLAAAFIALTESHLTFGGALLPYSSSESWRPSYCRSCGFSGSAVAAET